MKMKYFNIVLTVFLFLTLCILDLSLPTDLWAQCQTSIVSVASAPVQQLSVSDVDFDHFESNVLLFTLRLGTNTNGEKTKLHILLHVNLSSGTVISDPAMEFISDSFYVPQSGMTITNLDLGRSIRKSYFKLNDDAKKEVQDVALATGKFPAGKYLFQFSLEGCSTAGVKEIIIEIVNPSRIDLISPNEGETTNEFPLFEFFYDGVKTTLTVAEKSSDQSREEAISHEPPMLRIDLNRQNSFLYSSGRPLEHGKTYVWNVVGKSSGPGGTEVEVSSLIGLFTVSSSPQGSSEDAILKILEEMLGSKYHKIFEDIHKDSFRLTGQFILNGATIQQNELLKLLNELRSIGDSIELSFE
jgi:hypothetical protein